MFEWIKKLFSKSKEKVEKKVERSYVEKLIQNWEMSKSRKMMITGEDYYRGKQDILNKKRLVRNEKGDLVENFALVNHKIVDNQYSKLVDQKVNYLVGKPISFKSKDEKYAEELQKIFDKNFHRKFKYLTENALNNGVGWLHPYYDNEGNFKLRQFEPSEILPIYKDKDKEELEMVVRVYKEAVLGTYETIEKVEVYKKNGIDRYVRRKGVCSLECENIPYVIFTEGEEEKPFNWAKIPFIPFRYNQQEIPLIARVKSLQDAINTIVSNFQDNVTEDIRNTIFVLVNFGGEDPADFRRDLQDGIIKVNAVEGIAGDVKTLQVEVNSENYKTILEMLKKAIIENGRGFDAKDDRMSSNPNQMNIQSMYADIDLDANNMETEFQASFEQLLWFVDVHLGKEKDTTLQVIFDRDVLVNEGQTIENIAKSVGIISEETLVSMHPFVADPKAELERIKKEKEEKMEVYPEAFKNGLGDPDVKEE